VSPRAIVLCALAAIAAIAADGADAEVRVAGRIDLRSVATRDGLAWPEGGPAKLRYASGRDLRLAHGVLLLGWQSDAHPLDAAIVLHAADDRSGVVDVTEASLRWRPVPAGAWRSSLRVGAFFPEVSLESSGLGWTPSASLSTSADNAWIGEELRTLGIEATWSRPGRFIGSAHDWQVSAGLFTGNDTAGALLAWRGWTVGDRLSGLRERIALPALPTFEPDGGIPEQVPWTNPFREIDGRPGAYVLLGHAHASGWRSRLWLYDNFGDPSILKSGQYSWRTRFVHGWVERRWSNGWALAFEAMTGSTQMGPRAMLAVDNDYATSSLHLSRSALGLAWGLRAERFDVRDRDGTADDPNDERGSGLTLHASRALAQTGWTLIAEASRVNSERPARRLLGLHERRDETALSIALRRHF
jgi:hypothetical protein